MRMLMGYLGYLIIHPTAYSLSIPCLASKALENPRPLPTSLGLIWIHQNGTCCVCCVLCCSVCTCRVLCVACVVCVRCVRRELIDYSSSGGYLKNMTGSEDFGIQPRGPFIIALATSYSSPITSWMLCQRIPFSMAKYGKTYPPVSRLKVFPLFNK